MPAWKISTPSILAASSSPSIARALGVVARIAFSGHHHSQRGDRETSADRNSSADRRSDARNAGTMSDIIRSISTWHSGSPKRTLYSNSFGPCAVTISAGIQHAVERRAALPSCPHGRQDDASHDARHATPASRGRRRIGAHAAGVRTLVAVEDALVILRARRAGSRVSPSHSAKKDDLLADQKFLDHDLRAGGPKPPSNISRSRPRLPRGSAATTTPLPAASPSALTTIGAPCSRT